MVRSVSPARTEEAVGVADDGQHEGHVTAPLGHRVVARDLGEPRRPEDVGDAPAAALPEENERRAGAHRQAEEVVHLLVADVGAGGALDGDVVAGDDDGAAVHEHRPADLAVAREPRGLGVTAPGERAELVERSRVGEVGDAVADGAPAPFADGANPSGSTELGAHPLA